MKRYLWVVCLLLFSGVAGADGFHKDAIGDDLHPQYKWTFTSAANRGTCTAATGGSCAAEDLGSVAWQTDDDSFWVLLTVTPTWTEITGSGASFTDLDTDYGAETLTSVWDASGALWEIPNQAGACTAGDCDAAGEAGRICVNTSASTGQQLFICEGVTGWVLSGDGGGTPNTQIDGDHTDATQTMVKVYDMSGGLLEITNQAGVCPTGDCDASGEAGRVCINTSGTTGRQFFICEGAAGWVEVAGTGGGGGSGQIDADHADATQTMVKTYNMSGGLLEVTNQAGVCVAGDCDASGEAGRVCVNTSATTGRQFFVCEGVTGWVLSGDGTGSAAGQIDADHGDATQTMVKVYDMSGGLIEVTNQAGVCVAGDCDAAGEAGRICVNTSGTTGRQFFVCEGAAGWVEIAGTGGGGGTHPIASGDYALGSINVDDIDNSMTLSTPAPLAANECWFGVNSIICEGVSANDWEGRINLIDPTADQTWTFPDISGNVALTARTDGVPDTLVCAGCVQASDIQDGTISQFDISHTQTLVGNPGWPVDTAFWAADGIIFEGSTADDFEGKLRWDVTAVDKTIDLPDASGTLGLITSIFDCTAGDCNSVAVEEGELLDFGGFLSNSATEGLILPINDASCGGQTVEGQICWDGNSNDLRVGSGGAALLINGWGLLRDKDDAVNEDEIGPLVTFADGDFFDFGNITISGNAEGIILPKHATDCSSATGTAEGQVCWEADDDTLWIGNGSTVTQIGTGGGFLSRSGTTLFPATAGDNFGSNAAGLNWTIFGTGAATFNSNLAAVDFVVKGDTDATAFWVDGSGDCVNVTGGACTGSFDLDVGGTAGIGAAKITLAQTASGGALTLKEATGGSNFIKFQAPTAVTSDVTVTLLNQTRTIPTNRVEQDTRVKDIILPGPLTDDSSDIDFTLHTVSATTIIKVWCSTDTGTVTINLEERVETTPNTTGTDVLSAGLVCDAYQSSCASGCTVNTITNASIDAGDAVNLQVDAVASTPGVVRIHVEFTID